VIVVSERLVELVLGLVGIAPAQQYK
jgi:hypothetical protein